MSPMMTYLKMNSNMWGNVQSKDAIQNKILRKQVTAA
jgi:hypothetical protein